MNRKPPYLVLRRRCPWYIILEIVDPNNKKKPAIILHYNATKGGVDHGDKLTKEYSCVRRTQRWPFRLFLEVLDMATLNAFLLFKLKFPEWERTNRSSRRIFIEELTIELATPNVKRRQELSKNYHVTHQYISHLFESTVEEEPPTTSSQQGGDSGRCKFCKRSMDRKSRTKCIICKKFVCAKHKKESRKIYCPLCYNE